MNVYLIGITKAVSTIHKFLYSAGIIKVRIEDHKPVRTAKTESKIIEHYKNIGMDVLFIREYRLKPGEIAELIE